MEVERKIRKIGNSLGVIIPSNMLKEIGVGDGDTVFIALENDEIKIRNIAQKQSSDEFKQKVITIVEEYLKERDKTP